jgi:hypothetical protein
VCIGTASIARSTIATAEAIFWQAIVASAIPARTTSLDPRSKGRPGNAALPRTNRSKAIMREMRTRQPRKQNLIERYGADIRLPELRERQGKMLDAYIVCYVDLKPY